MYFYSPGKFDFILAINDIKDFVFGMSSEWLPNQQIKEFTANPR